MNFKKIIKAVAVFSIAIPTFVFAQEWQIQAPITVANSGIVEVLLLPELHSQVQDGLDLKVLGPDDNPRAFELYWREDRSAASLQLTQDSARLENKIFIWTAKIKEKDRLNVQSLKINVLSGDYIGKVDIFGLKDGAWMKLADKVALYKAGGTSQGEIKIKEGVYEGFRLEFTAYAKKPVPIGHVQVMGEKQGKDYAEISVPLTFQRKDSKDANNKDMVELTAALPGSGLYIKELELLSTAQFNGSWSLERQGITDGQNTYIPVVNGSISGVEKGTTSLKIAVGQTWKGKALNLRLISQDSYISEVKSLTLKIRVPRLVFLAETPGKYMVQTGLNNKILIRDYPSAKREGSLAGAVFSLPKANPNWKPESLIKLYALGGAAFAADGYEWSSAINVTEPGYYRFILHQRASLEGNFRGLRVVKGGNQVPYFLDNGVLKEIVLAAKEEYDRSKNATTWYIELPQASSHWTGFKLKANGIFNRTLKVERDQPKPVQGTLWRTVPWVNTSSLPAELLISLRGFPREETKIRLVMVHGDNEPLKIQEIIATYDAPAVYFLADASEGYELYGGNSSASAPSYDLELVQDQLMKQEPKPATLSEPKLMKSAGVTNAVFKLFVQNNWGLYIVLGLLALGLMLVIARLFPKQK
jgi:hypothetical protein